MAPSATGKNRKSFNPTSEVRYQDNRPNAVTLADLEGPELWKRQIRIDLRESKKCFRWAFECLWMAAITFLLLARTRTNEAIRCWASRLQGPAFPLVSRRRSASWKELLAKNPLCSKCGQNPHGKNSQWCDPCRNKYHKERRIKLAGSWYRNLTEGQKTKRKATAAFIQRVWRGSVIPQPCAWCGDPKTEADHYLGYDGENAFRVIWLCKTHHTERTYGKIYIDTINFREVLVRKL